LVYGPPKAAGTSGFGHGDIYQPVIAPCVLVLVVWAVVSVPEELSGGVLLLLGRPQIGFTIWALSGTAAARSAEPPIKAAFKPTNLRIFPPSVEDVIGRIGLKIYAIFSCIAGYCF
jgi:hypothetical protein